MTEVVGFYGFKGGAGRSLILAHLAAIFAAKGESVLIVDSDLEAPGLGDFFDTKGTTVFERWRQARGLTDLMRDLAKDRTEDRMRSPGDREKRIKWWMEGEAAEPGLLRRDGADRPGLIRIELDRGNETKVPGDSDIRPAPIWLLGPGSHRAEPGTEAQSYVANFLKFDWNAFTRQGGDEILGALGKYLRGGAHGFDYVLIDARTGYNFPSILFLQHFATKVIGVSTLSSQAIDGMARMLPVMTISQRPDEAIETFLVVNKCPISGEVQATDDESPPGISVYKGNLVNHYFQGEVRERTVFWLPAVENLQTHDSLIWSVETSEGYSQAARRVITPETPSVAQQLAWRAQDSAYRFVNEIFRLHRRLTGSDDTSAGLSEEEDKLNASLFEMFRVEKHAQLGPGSRSSGTPLSDFLQASGTTDKSSEKNLEATKDLADQIVELILTNGLAENEGKMGRSDELRARFQSLGKDRRALVRSLIVEELRKVAEPDEPDRLKKRSLMIEKANEWFFLNLEPTQAVAAVIRPEQVDLSRLDEATVMQAICELVTEAQGEKAQAIAEQFREKTNRMTGTGRKFAALLASYPQVFDRTTTAPLAAFLEEITELARTLDRFPAPRTAKDFGLWNLYDLADPVVEAASRALARDNGPNELVLALEQFSEVMLVRLADPAPWRSIDALGDDLARQRWQWADYTSVAVRARRLSRVHGLGEVPLDAVGLLSAEEAAALRAVHALPMPEAVADWRWPKPGPIVLELASRTWIEALILTLEIEGTRAPASAMVTLISGLADEVLRHPMARFGTEAGLLNRLDEPRQWFQLIQRLSLLADTYDVHDRNLRLCRRLSRLAQQSGGTIENARWAAVSTVAVGHKFGADISITLAGELAEAVATRQGKAADSEAENYRTWPAATLCAKGYYREARDLIRVSPVTEQQDVRLNSWLRFAYESNVGLGEVEEAERLHTRLRKLVVAPSQPLASVRAAMAAADLKLAQLKLDVGRPAEQVLPFLHGAIEIVGKQEDVGARALRSEAEILLMLIGKIATNSDNLEVQLETAMAQQMGVLHLGPDRAAAEFGSRLWTGGGIFPGTELNAGVDRWMGRFLDPAICILIDSGAEQPARSLLGRWRMILSRHDGCEDPAPAVHWARALAAAAAYRLYGRAVDRAVAEAGREADCAVNGQGRAALYVRPFAAAGIS